MADTDRLRALNSEKDESLTSKDAIIAQILLQLNDKKEGLMIQDENLPVGKYEQVIKDLKDVTVKAKSALKIQKKRTFTPQVTHKFQGDSLSKINSSLQKKRAQRNSKRHV